MIQARTQDFALLVRHVKMYWSGPLGPSRPTALGLFTACENFKFWTEGRTDLQKYSNSSSWRAHSKYLSTISVNPGVQEISSPKDSVQFSGRIQAVFRPEKLLILGFESSTFTYISMLKKFGHSLMNSSQDTGGGFRSPPPYVVRIFWFRTE